MTRISQWLHKSVMIAWVINVLGVIGVGYWAADRKAPFRIIESPTNLHGAPGTTLKAAIKVHRVHRGCAVDFTRFIFDAHGTRFDMQGVQHMTADAIAEMDLAMPGELNIAFEVPRNAAPGPAYLATSLAYVCNPVHYVFPIQVNTRMPFTIDMEK